MNQNLKLPRPLRGAAPRADGTPEGINLSQLLDQARCGYRWQLRYRRGIDRRIIAPAMDLGSAVHAGIAGGVRHYANLKKGFKTVSAFEKALSQAAAADVMVWGREWASSRGVLTEETQQLLYNTIDKGTEIAWRALKEMNLPRWRIVRLKSGQPLVEQKITWTIPTLEAKGLKFYGTADFVADDLEEGGRWVWDYKVRERFVSSEDEQFDAQLPTYQHGLLQQKPPIPTTGAIKFQIRADLPAQPKLNQNGTMSRQRVATTWDVYKAALIQAKLDPKDYEDEMRQKLDVKFFQLDRIYRNNFYVNQLWAEVTLPQVKEFLRRKHFHRVLSTWGCNGCWAREFCLGELRGEDMSFLLQTSFVDTTKPAEKLILRPEDVELI